MSGWRVLSVLFWTLAWAVLPQAAHADSPDCIDQAAAYHGVNSQVLRAIGWHESRLRPQAMGYNRNGTVDIGAFQINSVHLPALARYGVDQRALAEGCVSAYVAAWHYRRQVDEFGNTWMAVGAYHSRTPARAAWYANQIARQLMQWGVTPPGPLPYPAATTAVAGPTGAPAGLKNLPASQAMRAVAGTPVFSSPLSLRTEEAP